MTDSVTSSLSGRLNGQGDGEINTPVKKHGNYTISVNHARRIALGSYSLMVNYYNNRDDHGNTCAQATPLKLSLSGSVMMDGVINSPGDIDYFKVDLPRKMQVQIETIGDINTFGLLHQGNCGEPIYNGDAGHEQNFRLSQELDTGTYYIGVKHGDPPGTGSYRLLISKI